MPFVGRDGVSDVADHFSRKAFGASWVGQGESNGVSGVSDNGPVAPIPALRTAVQCVVVVVLVGQDVVCLAVDGEAGILDAIGIAT